MTVRFHRSNKYLPKDTYKILSNRSIEHDDNFYFLFNFPIIYGDPMPEKIRINEEIEEFKWEKNFLRNIQDRKRNLNNLLQNNGFKVSNFQAKCQWRLVIGLGASHPQETSMTLHHIYGIPYIPGSAVKGITRHWAVLKFADSQNKKIGEISDSLEKGKDLNIEVDGIKFNELIEIFGTQDKAGKVIFMDAYPVDDIKLKIDIMNPHYPEYYFGKEPPADWQNPKPIKFLTVENTEFQFSLMAKDEKILKRAEALLKEALREHGIGAKTTIGYGSFEFKEEMLWQKNSIS